MESTNYNLLAGQKLVLEVCVESVQSAVAAEKGGAQRVELCSGLSEGGLTPSYGLIQVVRKSIGIGLHVLIRPRRGDFLYSELEVEIMKRDIEIAKELGADGVVLGALRPEGHVDLELMQDFIAVARPLSVTFHRAFDVTPDPLKALDDLMHLKVDRLLTSGQQGTALEGAALISNLIERAGNSLIVMPGSGVNERNMQELLKLTRATEFHTSARKKVASDMIFRRSDLPMAGVQQLTEYENLVADKQKIAAICNLSVA
ncbi:copper homeostasis protein CutC [Pontibacter qinzhouensis]|uniref:PF03932 family protein CutC n=1 Tax=Pontibacter qinzhouensis TaxID=2603253 RepID=A0A5C8JIR3_9BACT|nr:copper homeostasis protein CutC [Pontibacter qinzhouensis]TXK37669.1 copper homeostasis protein CutC [Pontibacter qinzhouensis]